MSSFNAYVSNDIIPITPTDTPTTFVNGCVVCKGVAGNVAVMTGAGNIRTVPIAAGEILQCYIQYVLATGTTATGLYLYPL